MWIAEVEKCYHTQLLIYYRKSRHSSEAVFVYTVYSDIFIVRFLFFHNMSEGNTQGCKLRVSPWYNIISVFGQRHDICRFDTEACDRHEMTSSAHLTQSITFISTHSNKIWQFYYWTLQWRFYCINGSKHWNGKQSILFYKKKVLFRNELDGNGDTDLLWEFQNKGVS